MSGHLYSPDDEVMFRTTESLATRFALDIKPIALGFSTSPGKDNKEYAQYGIGQPLLAIPFYWVGHLFRQIPFADFYDTYYPDLFRYHDGTDVEWAHRFGVSLFNQFIAALFCVIFYSFVYQLTSQRKFACLGTLLFGAGTYLWPHSRPFFSELLAGFMIFSSFFALYLAFKLRKHRYFFMTGVLFGYALLVRIDSILFAPGLGIFFFMEWAGLRKSEASENASDTQVYSHKWIQVLITSLPLLFFIFLILGLNYIRYGNFFTTGYEDQPEGIAFSAPLLAGLYAFLFSIGKGLFFFSPPLILFPVSIGGFVKKHRSLAWGIIAGILVFFLMQCTWRNFAGGWCWGPRHIFQIHAFMALIVAVWLSEYWRSSVRILYSVLLIVGIGVQILGSSQNFITYYIEFYRTPTDGLFFNSLYGPEEDAMLSEYYTVYAHRSKSAQLNPVPPSVITAPINDSIYIPQQSQWRGYILMLKRGYLDFFWINLIRNPMNQPRLE